MTHAVLLVPMPPSTNELYGTNWRTRRRFNSKRYETWQQEAGWALKQQKMPVIEGNYMMTLSFGPRKGDVGNREKAVSDLLVKHGIVEDDSLADEIHLYWDAHVTGCQIEIDNHTDSAARQGRGGVKPITKPDGGVKSTLGRFCERG